MTAIESTLRRYDGDYAAHEHGHAQVLLGLAGSLELEIGGRGAFVDASCGLIVPAGVRHGYLARHPASVLVIDAPARKGLDRMRRFRLTARGAGVDAPRLLDELAGTQTLLPRRRLDLAAIEARVDAELHRGWTTAQLAALCHLSPQRFHARFVELTGVAPLAFVRQRRLDRAQRLIRSGLTLETAASQVGYASASSLAFALKRERGAGVRTLSLRDLS
jgi:AraC-like DNA-binding protein